MRLFSLLLTLITYSCTNQNNFKNWVYLAETNESEQVLFDFPKATLYVNKNTFIDSIKSHLDINPHSFFKIKTLRGDTDISTEAIYFDQWNRIVFKGDSINLKDTVAYQSSFDSSKYPLVVFLRQADTINDVKKHLYDFLFSDYNSIFEFDSSTFLVKERSLFWLRSLTYDNKLESKINFDHFNNFLRELIFSFVKKGNCRVFDKRNKKFVNGVYWCEGDWAQPFLEFSLPDNKVFYYYNFPGVFR